MSHKIDWTTVLAGNTDGKATLIGETPDRYIYCYYHVEEYTSEAGVYYQKNVNVGYPVYGLLQVVGAFGRTTGGGVSQNFPFGTVHASTNGIELSSTCYSTPNSNNINFLTYNRQAQSCRYAVRVYFTVLK